MISISCIIPCFNGANFLREAIDSVLAQEYEALEVLVIDDGSTDSSATIAASYGPSVRVISQENRGLTATRNIGIEAATGEAIAFLDHDDMWLPGKLVLQAELLDRDADAVVGAMQRIVPSADSPTGYVPHDDPLPSMSLTAALIRTATFDSVGEFDESLVFGADWDWFLRAREQGAVIRQHPEVVLHYRRHDDNMTNDVSSGNRATLQLLKSSIDRRRAQAGRAESLPPIES